MNANSKTDLLRSFPFEKRSGGFLSFYFCTVYSTQPNVSTSTPRNQKNPYLYDIKSPPFVFNNRFSNSTFTQNFIIS